MIRHRVIAACAWIAVAFLLGLVPSIATGEELTIAAASDLSGAFKELVADYEKTTGHRVRLTLGSSGNFFSQIQNGAPFDLYFSADVQYPQKLVESGQAVPESLYRYAIGRIVLWAPRGSPLDVKNRGMDVLSDPSIKRIAIANPKHAPYGRAAVAAMEHFRAYEQVRGKLVLGENIAQAAQFIESGAADVGIIALSLALVPPVKEAGQYWLIPAETHPSIEQGAVMLRASKNKEAARMFLEFVRGARGREIMGRYGFTSPN